MLSLVHTIKICETKMVTKTTSKNIWLQAFKTTFLKEI